MTYARARLGPGLTGTALLLFLTLAAYVYQMPSTFFPYFGGPWYSDWAGFVVCFLAYAGLSLPFDIWGGFTLPHSHQRHSLLFPEFLLKWSRGLLVQGLVMTFCALLLLQAGKLAGIWAATGTLLALQLALLAFQWPLARWTGGLAAAPAHPGSDAITAIAGDVGFTGGLAGLPGLEHNVQPLSWNTTLSPPALLAEHLRRQGLAKTGARTRGVLLALGWNLLGFVLSASLPWGGVDTIYSLLETLLGCTLWSFLGLLVLPSFSRPGTLEADRYAAANGAARPQLEAAICEIDQLQDEDLSRPGWFEILFCTVPSVENRLNALDSKHQPYGAWLAARMALYLSWANFGLLSRAVHSNVGHPELWVLPPGD
ncbi:hypothetical protein [Paludibaculum fermentans]|uniref:hypothetical protein n=1 Tax=Paludibaculum fermentans TaxID=1473598 RepID=UPI003EBDD6B3